MIKTNTALIDIIHFLAAAEDGQIEIDSDLREIKRAMKMTLKSYNKELIKQKIVVAITQLRIRKIETALEKIK